MLKSELSLVAMVSVAGHAVYRLITSWFKPARLDRIPNHVKGCECNHVMKRLRLIGLCRQEGQPWSVGGGSRSSSMTNMT
ncbi:hypothetical protein RRG08_031466 [Elysia crispata]|uniref:Uncharacterized protein n=1 Tax=Elysia crispata TaxID=231223 RepID=A0AAE0ZNI2_9GAST|nr:hypothetical protein RRG08_031466 [Elysia crispata]